MDSNTQPPPPPPGVSLVSMSLCCDAIIGNVQEAALKSSQEPGARLVLYSYGIGLGVIALLLLGMGAGGSSAVFVYQVGGGCRGHLVRYPNSFDSGPNLTY